MEHEKELALECDHDPFAEAAKTDDAPSRGGGGGWLDGAQEERAREPEALERPPENSRCQALDVDDDVGQLGHARAIVPATRGTLKSVAADRRELLPGRRTGWRQAGKRVVVDLQVGVLLQLLEVVLDLVLKPPIAQGRADLLLHALEGLRLALLPLRDRDDVEAVLRLHHAADLARLEREGGLL